MTEKIKVKLTLEDGTIFKEDHLGPRSLQQEKLCSILP